MVLPGQSIVENLRNAGFSLFIAFVFQKSLTIVPVTADHSAANDSSVAKVDCQVYSPSLHPF